MRALSSQNIRVRTKREERRGKKEEISNDVDMVKDPAAPKQKAKGRIKKERFGKSNQDTTVEMVI